MAGVLELPELAQHHGVAEREVRPAGVDPELDPKRAAELQLRLEAAFGDELDRAARAARPGRRGPWGRMLPARLRATFALVVLRRPLPDPRPNPGVYSPAMKTRRLFPAGVAFIVLASLASACNLPETRGLQGPAAGPDVVPVRVGRVVDHRAPRHRGPGGAAQGRDARLPARRRGRDRGPALLLPPRRRRPGDRPRRRTSTPPRARSSRAVRRSPSSS